MSEVLNSFLRPWKNKAFEEKRSGCTTSPTPRSRNPQRATYDLHIHVCGFRIQMAMLVQAKKVYKTTKVALNCGVFLGRWTLHEPTIPRSRGNYNLLIFRPRSRRRPLSTVSERPNFPRAFWLGPPDPCLRSGSSWMANGMIEADISARIFELGECSLKLFREIKGL